MDFKYFFWDGFQLKCNFSGRNLDLIEGVLKIMQEFECKGSSFEPFFLCKYYSKIHHCKAII